MIYFFQPVSGGPVKIGHSGDVAQRRQQLELHYGQPLAVLAILPGGRDEERVIHERFSEIRLGHTEQFKPTAELMAFIGLPLLVGANPDAVEAMTSFGQEIILVYKADKRASGEFKAWLEGLADKVKAPVTVLLDMALNEFAEKRKYRPMPDRLYRKSKGQK